LHVQHPGARAGLPEMLHVQHSEVVRRRESVAGRVCLAADM